MTLTDRYVGGVGGRSSIRVPSLLRLCRFFLVHTAINSSTQQTTTRARAIAKPTMLPIIIALLESGEPEEPGYKVEDVMAREERV